MTTPELKSMLISEDNYASSMHETVLPYISEREEEFLPEREAGRRLHCKRYVPEAPKAVLLICHGFTESIAKFGEMIYYYLNAGCAVYICEHCGHAGSYRLTDDLSKVHVDSWKRYTDDFIFIAHIAESAFPGLPVFVYAHSMGGAVAASAAAIEPELFSRLVLSSPMIRSVRGGFPWTLTRFVCWLFVHIGKAEDYAPGQHAYEGPEKFEDSAATSRARFDFYQEIRFADPQLQMNGATYGWLHAATQISVFIQSRGCRNITAPVLLFQAENETFVINRQQDIFIEKLKSRGVDAGLVCIPGTKHEYYRSDDATMLNYLERIFRFYEI